MKKIGLCNNKGGVSKTRFSISITGAFAEMDQQGSAMGSKGWTT